MTENLGLSSTAYEAAKERFENQYGGRCHQIAIYIEVLDEFRQIRPESANDLEDFSDLLDIAIINLNKTGQHYKLGDGSLYKKNAIQSTGSNAGAISSWMFENRKPESVVILRTWVIQESEFRTIASETV